MAHSVRADLYLKGLVLGPTLLYIAIKARGPYPLVINQMMSLQQHMRIDSTHSKRACAGTTSHICHFQARILPWHDAGNVLLFLPLMHCGLDVHVKVF